MIALTNILYVLVLRASLAQHSADQCAGGSCKKKSDVLLQQRWTPEPQVYQDLETDPAEPPRLELASAAEAGGTDATSATAWVVEVWGDCVSGCGDGVLQFRDVKCRSVFDDKEAADGACSGLRPGNARTCSCDDGCKSVAEAECPPIVNATGTVGSILAPVGCFEFAPPGDDPGAQDPLRPLDCKTNVDGAPDKPCMGGLPFYAKKSTSMEPNACMRFCLSKSLDIAGLDGDGTCRCGGSAANRQLFSQGAPRAGVVFRPEALKKSSAGAACPLQVYRFTGPYEAAGVPDSFNDQMEQDLLYLDTIVAGEDTTELAERWPGSGRDGSTGYQPLWSKHYPGQWLDVKRMRASQSSTGHGGVAQRAVDGCHLWLYKDGCCTHTRLQNRPWWKLDLGGKYAVQVVLIENRGDCCWDRLTNFEIAVDNKLCPGGSKSVHKGRKQFACNGLEGSELKIISNKRTYLTLCEVGVKAEKASQRARPIFSGWIKLKGLKTSQSSTGWGGYPRLAVDGDSEGNYRSRSCTHTGRHARPWWKVELGKPYLVKRVLIKNRADCCGWRLSRFMIQVGFHLCGSTRHQSISQGAIGAYECLQKPTGDEVKITSWRTDYLTICEVDIDGERFLK